MTHRHKIEKSWQKINRSHLFLAAEGLLRAKVDVQVVPANDGREAKVIVRYTDNADYRADIHYYFDVLNSLNELFGKLAERPRGRSMTGPSSVDGAEFAVATTYRLPLVSAKYAGGDPNEFLKRMGLFEVASVLAQGIGKDFSVSHELLEKFPDPRRKLEVVIRRCFLMDYAARVYLPQRRESPMNLNERYFDRQ